MDEKDNSAVLMSDQYSVGFETYDYSKIFTNPKSVIVLSRNANHLQIVICVFRENVGKLGIRENLEWEVPDIYYTPD